MNQATVIAKSGSKGMPLIKDLIDTVQNLTELMTKETELLRAMRVKEFATLQEKKLTLVSHYEELTASLGGDPGFVESLHPRLRRELSDVAQRMHGIMQENEQAISAAREINQRVASTIVDAVLEQRPEASVYSNTGGYQTQKKTPPVSVQVDGRF